VGDSTKMAVRETLSWSRRGQWQFPVEHFCDDCYEPCSTCGGEERCIQGFGGETWGKESTWRIQA